MSKNGKVVSFEEAVACVQDYSTVFVAGIENIMLPDRTLQALENRFLTTGHPQHLREFHTTIRKRQIVLNRRHQKDVAGSGFAYRLHGWQPRKASFRLVAARQCGQQILEVLCRVQPVGLCGLNQRIDHRTDLRAKRCIAEQPVLSANGKRSDRTFRTVVGQLQPSVAENVHQPALLPQGIAKRCAIETLWHRIFLVFILRPPKEFSGNWLGSLFPPRISLFRRKRLL